MNPKNDKGRKPPAPPPTAQGGTFTALEGETPEEMAEHALKLIDELRVAEGLPPLPEE